MPTKQYLSAFVLITLLSFGLWGSRLSHPFEGRHENNTAFMTISGVNYLRYGLFDYGFAQILNLDPSIETPDYFYLHHPPLGSLLAALSINLFGEHELSSRIIPIFLTLIAMSAFGLWLKRRWSIPIAIISLSFFASFPMIAYYAQMLNHEPLLLAFAMMMLPILDSFLEKPSNQKLVLIALLNILMLVSGWQGYFFTGIYFFYALMAKNRSFKLAIILAFTGILALLLWTVPLAITFPHFLPNLYEQFLLRSGIEDRPWNSIFDFLWEIAWARWRPRFTEAAAILSLIAIIMTLFKGNYRQNPSLRLVYLLLLPPFLQIFVFRQQTFHHDYTLYYFAPALAILCAIATVELAALAFHKGNPWKWVNRGVLLLLILAYTASSLRWTYSLYTERSQFAAVAGTIIRQETPEGTVIYTQDLGWTTALWYYSQREFSLITQAPSTNYTELYCVTDNSLENPLIQSDNYQCNLLQH